MIWYNKDENGRARVVISRNISAIGTMFLAEEYLSCNTNLKLKLKVPYVKDHIEAKGEVIRVQSAPGMPFYKTAIKFGRPSKKIGFSLYQHALASSDA